MEPEQLEDSSELNNTTPGAKPVRRHDAMVKFDKLYSFKVKILLQITKFKFYSGTACNYSVKHDDTDNKPMESTGTEYTL